MTSSDEARPLQPYIVLDANVLRKEHRINDVVNRCLGQGQRILLPDIAIYEMTKGKAYETWRRSLVLLARHPELVFAARHLGDLMASEVSTGEPDTRVADEQATPYFRNLLKALDTGDDTLLNDSLNRLVGFLAQEMKKREDHAGNKRRVLDIIDGWKSNLTGRKLSKARSGDEKLLECLLGDLPTARSCRELLEQDRCTAQVANYLTVAGGAYVNYVYTMMALALDWLAKDGYQTRAEEAFTNDVHDVDYIAVSLLCSDLVSEEHRVNRIRRRVQRALLRRLNVFRAMAGPVWHGTIATAAYCRWRQNGGQHGKDVEDWLEAERMLIQQILERDP